MNTQSNSPRNELEYESSTCRNTWPDVLKFWLERLKKFLPTSERLKKKKKKFLILLLDQIVYMAIIPFKVAAAS